LGFSRGWDVVGRVDTAQEWNRDQQRFRISLAQDFSPRLRSQINYQHQSENGFLSNPYLAAREQGALVPERSPSTRIQHQLSLITQLYSDPRAVSTLHYGFLTDSWDIDAHMAELSYTQPFNLLNTISNSDNLWHVDLHYRYYQQDSAGFFSDNALISRRYNSRDKWLSAYDQHGVGVILSYEWGNTLGNGLNDVSLNFSIDLARVNFKNYTHWQTGEAYQFNATSTQFYLSWQF
jgi:hypothetical protein